MPSKRVDLKAILHNPVYRRKLMVGTIVATQAREGITTTQEQAESAYDKVLMTLANKNCSIKGMKGSIKG